MSDTATRRVAKPKDLHPRTLDRIRSAGGQRAAILLVIVAMLVVIGLGAMLSASSVVSISTTSKQFDLFSKQLIWVGLGTAALVVAAFIPYRLWQRFALPIFLAAVAGLVLTVAVGDERGGAVRWIEVGPVTLQVAELAKFATVTLLAAILTKKRDLVHNLGHVIAPVGVILGTVSILLLMQPDFGNLLLVVVPAFVMLTASTVPLRYVFGLGALGTIVMTGLAMSAEYRKDRLLSFLDPFASAQGTGLQAVQSMVALGSGGFFGVGLGMSRARWSWLPNAHTDFIFAIIGEETGFAGAGIVMTLFALFAVVGISIAFRAPDLFSRLLAVGIVSWLTIQALVNIGGVIAVLPITGVPLPFISAGGNAMLMNLFAVGVLINIALAPPAGTES
ncbi:MAG: putative lipid II flippase FtsW [Actinomycetota bacterium]